VSLRCEFKQIHEADDEINKKVRVLPSKM